MLLLSLSICLSWPKPVVLLGLLVDFWIVVALIWSLTEQWVPGNLVRFFLFCLIRGTGDSCGWWFLGWAIWFHWDRIIGSVFHSGKLHFREDCSTQVGENEVGKTLCFHSRPAMVCGSPQQSRALQFWVSQSSKPGWAEARAADLRWPTEVFHSVNVTATVNRTACWGWSLLLTTAIPGGSHSSSCSRGQLCSVTLTLERWCSQCLASSAQLATAAWAECHFVSFLLALALRFKIITCFY